MAGMELAIVEECPELAIVEVCPTEDIVLALLDFLVDPLLPPPKDKPLYQEDLVAKQVHAVALLYNYYHRKLNPGHEFLNFISFCKLAVALKPSLLSYLTFMQSSDYGGLELEGIHNQMSLTEKEVVNACDVSKSLDAFKKKPVIEGWPISKVAVFLVDSKKENCILFHSSITQGVWAVVEKEVCLPGEESAKKNQRLIKKTPKQNLPIDEAGLQKTAYLAVKEACGFTRGDLRILEAHTVYSTSKAKMAVRLYIMWHTSSSQDESLVPISDVLESMKGPLVKKEFGSWSPTPVIDYFHLLPFADEVENWLSRSKDTEVEDFPDLAPEYEEEKDIDNCNPPLNEKLVVNTSESLGVSKDTTNNNNGQLKKQVVNTSKSLGVSKDTTNNNNGQLKKKQVIPDSPPHREDARPSVSEMPVEGKFGSPGKNVPSETVVFKRRKKNTSPNDQGRKKNRYTTENSEHVKECAVNGDIQKEVIVAQKPEQLAVNRSSIVVTENPDPIPDKQSEDKACYEEDEKQDHAIISHDFNSDSLKKIQPAISKTALNVLRKKKERLAQQIRMHADKLAICDHNIETILNGGEDDLAMKINSLIEYCNDSCLKSSATEDLDLSPPMKRKRLSEANLSSHDPCQMLDSICNDSNWTLPTYNISTSEGGFKTSISVKGVDFECSSEGIVAPTPQNARTSAALFMLSKLQSMQWKCTTSTRRVI